MKESKSLARKSTIISSHGDQTPRKSSNERELLVIIGKRKIHPFRLKISNFSGARRREEERAERECEEGLARR